jgi:tetratricopeptide (TPR) repeat protein
VFLKKLFDFLPKDPFSKGLSLFNEGELQSAADIFSTLLDHPDPEICKKARLFACEAHLQMGDNARGNDTPAALDHYHRAAVLQPNFADVQNKLGESYRLMSRHSQALEAFSAALAINPRYFAARMNLAHTHVQMDDYQSAKAELEQALPHAANYVKDSLEELLQVCETEDRTAWDGKFEQLRRQHPSEAEGRRLEALKLVQRGQPAEALRILDELLEKHSKWPDLHLLRGLALGELGQLPDAVEAFLAAIEQHPRYLKARINLGLTYMEMGQDDDARRELEFALDTDPANVLARAALEELRDLPAIR